MSSPAPARSQPVVVAADALHGFIAAVFGRMGFATAHAATVADLLVWSNLRGVDTHGVVRVPRYVEMIRAGEMNPAPAMRLGLDLPAMFLLDADRAAGPVAMTHATRLAVDRARVAGVALAMVRGTTHTGALGYYTSLAAQEGVAALAFSASGPNMAYHGARAAGVATNPISIAVPGGEHGPLVLDMATSVISLGRIMSARRLGETLPEGVALDRDGNPATDAKVAEVPLPLGGPKGSGLSLMIECLASVATGNALIAEALEGTPAGRRHRQNGIVIAIDIAKLGPLDTFRDEVRRLARDVKALPADRATGEILMPGERGDAVFKQRRRDGIPIPKPVHAELATLAAALGVALPA
jgi:LDH2 family malate/lactate/ureidoglycolate dehydrogenase